MVPVGEEDMDWHLFWVLFLSTLTLILEPPALCYQVQVLVCSWPGLPNPTSLQTSGPDVASEKKSLGQGGYLPGGNHGHTKDGRKQEVRTHQTSSIFTDKSAVSRNDDSQEAWGCVKPSGAQLLGEDRQETGPVPVGARLTAEQGVWRGMGPTQC